MLTLAAAVGMAGISASGVLSDVDWRRRQPAWWLIRESRSTNPAVVGPVLRELLARLEQGNLSDERLLQVALQGLEYRDLGSPSRLWNFEYGNLLDAAWAKGLLTPEQIERYAVNSVGVWWHGPSHRTYPEAPDNPFIGVNFVAYVGHTSRSTIAPVRVDFEVCEFSAALDGQPLTLDLLQRADDGADGNPRDASRCVAIIEMPSEWQQRRLSLAWVVQVVDMESRAPIGPAWHHRVETVLDASTRGGARRQDQEVPPNISRW